MMGLVDAIRTLEPGKALCLGLGMIQSKATGTFLGVALEEAPRAGHWKIDLSIFFKLLSRPFQGVLKLTR